MGVIGKVTKSLVKQLVLPCAVGLLAIMGAGCSTPQSGTLATISSPYHISTPGGEENIGTGSPNVGWWADTTVVCMPLGGHLTVKADQVPYHYDPDSDPTDDLLRVTVNGAGYGWGVGSDAYPLISLAQGESFTTPNEYTIGSCVTVGTTTAFPGVFGGTCDVFFEEATCYHAGFKATVTWPTL